MSVLMFDPYNDIPYGYSVHDEESTPDFDFVDEEEVYYEKLRKDSELIDEILNSKQC